MLRHVGKRIGNMTTNVRFFQSNQNQKEEIKNLLLLLKPEWKLYSMGIAVTAFSSAVLLVLPKALKEIGELQELRLQPIQQDDSEENKQAKETHNQEVQNKYYTFGFKWSALTILSGVLGYYRRQINLNIINHLAVRLRNAYYQRFLSQNPLYFQDKGIHTSDLVHRLGNDVSQLSYGMAVELLFGLRGIFFIFGGSAYLLMNAQPLIPPALIMMFFLGFSTKKIGQYQRYYKAKEMDSLAATSQLAQEKLQALKLIKISDMEKQEKKKYMIALSQFYDNASKYVYYFSLNYGIMEGLGFTSLIGILTYGSYIITSGVAPPGLVSSTFYAFYVAMGFRSVVVTYTELLKVAGIYQGLDKLFPNIHDDPVYKNTPLLKQYKEFIEIGEKEKEQLENPPETTEKQEIVQPDEYPPMIELKNISFSHSEHKVLDNLTLTIKAGSVTAIIGKSGSGKTTIFNLLTKILSPQDGQIYFDGNPLSDKDYSWIQQHISYVPQEATIFTGSIYENIIYGNQGFDQSMSKVRWAAKMAKADEFIDKMKDGYMTQLKSDGGVSLSGGQKQRIVLARSILKDPKILILDEATSNIDSEAEQLIIEALKQICKNRTCILVTHKIENYKSLITDEIHLSKD